MFRFGFSHKLSSLLLISVTLGVLLCLNLSAEAEENSPTLTVLNVEEMSQIAGGTCKKIGHTGGSSSGSCRPNGSLCASGSHCGSNPYTTIYSSQYCSDASTGYRECWCNTTTPGWRMYNCQICIYLTCLRSYIGSGGSHIVCTGSVSCPSN